MPYDFTVLIAAYARTPEEVEGFTSIFQKAADLAITLTLTMKLTILSEWRYLYQDGSQRTFSEFVTEMLTNLEGIAEAGALTPSEAIILYIARKSTLHVNVSPSFMSATGGGLYKTTNMLGGMLMGYVPNGDNSELDLSLSIWADSFHNRGPAGDFEMMFPGTP